MQREAGKLGTQTTQALKSGKPGFKHQGRHSLTVCPQYGDLSGPVGNQKEILTYIVTSPCGILLHTEGQLPELLFKGPLPLPPLRDKQYSGSVLRPTTSALLQVSLNDALTHAYTVCRCLISPLTGAPRELTMS